MKRNKGFTIVEMMVVITIIMILLGLLMPALGRARKKARKIDCMNRLRQIGIALNEYALDNNGSFPAALATLTTDDAYLPSEPVVDGNPVILICPSAGTYTYAAPDGGNDEAHLTPSHEWITCDADHGGASPTNLLMGDGSVTCKAAEE